MTNSGDSIASPQSAGQQKKALKDARRKIYADLLVQGTNDSSIVSKRSVEMLYSSILTDDTTQEVPHFFHHFVKKPQRRSPAINRGYWIRMNAIKKCIDKIIAADDCKTNVIVNLGCGYDPLPFQVLDRELQFLRNKRPDMEFLCIDIDYPELIDLKVQMIKNSPELLEIIGEIDTDTEIEGMALKTKSYAAVGCNLRDLALFQRQLTQLGLHELNTCSVFVAEVSLAYMLPEHADAVIKESATFPKSHFLILEQLLPTNEPRHPFGRTMLHHFNRLNTPLQCVPVYNTIADQKRRFTSCGFPEVEARDLLGCWEELIPEEEKQRVRTVEAFDEFEEFIFYTQHYIVLHATNSSKSCFHHENKQAPFLKRDQRLQLRYNEAANLDRKFHAAAVDANDDILVVAGSAQNRLNTTVVMSQTRDKYIAIKNHNLPQRMCHTLTAIGYDNEYILIGGRNAPHKPLQDCWKLHRTGDLYEWTRLRDAPTTRSRHVSFRVNTDEIICFGGAPSGVGSAFTVYNTLLNTWRDLEIRGEVPNLRSAAVAYDIATGTGYITGGAREDHDLNANLYAFTYNGECISVCDTGLTSNLLQRYGAKMCFMAADGSKEQQPVLVVVGGVSTNFALDRHNTIITVDLGSFEIRSVEMSQELWHDGSMFVGFELLSLHDGSAVCVGGGGVCFGFGSFWNDKILKITGVEQTGTEQRVWNTTSEITV